MRWIPTAITSARIRHFVHGAIRDIYNYLGFIITHFVMTSLIICYRETFN